MTELDLLIDLHLRNHRQGPGSTTETLKAMALTGLNPASSLKVADIGCGTGASTLILARETNWQIRAVDLFPAFLNKLEKQASSTAPKQTISLAQEDMNQLSFKAQSLDLIWSEGAIYSMGFANGLKKWREFLVDDGILAISEICWTSANRPAEIEAYWNAEYPEIATLEEKAKQMESHGYKLIDSFILEANSWLNNYFEPLEQTIPLFLEEHKHTELAQKVVELHRMEYELYRKFQAYYSYGFFIARKI